MIIYTWPMALISVALIALLYRLYWRWSNRRLLELAALMPGPPTLPVLGNAWIFMAKPEQLLEIIEKLLGIYGQYMRFWIGADLSVVVKNPDDIRLLLTSNKINVKGPLYEFLKPYTGPGILSGGPTWRNHRKIANSSYNKKAVHDYSVIFNREAEDLANALSKRDQKTFDVYFDVVKCTTQSVCQTLMGLTKEESQNVKCMDEVVLLTQNIYNLIFTKMTNWWLRIPIIFWLTGRKKKEKYYVKLIENMTSDILAKRKKALLNDRIEEEVTGVVDRFLFSGELSEQEIKWETFTLFTTSQEASAKIASAVLLLLAHLPDWQGKVYKEIVEVLGLDDEFVTDEELKKLKNLDVVYKEALRYMSIGAFIQRTVMEEITIKDGKITLPAGASVIFPIHIVHRDPQYWENPHKVMPERFLPEYVKTRNPNAFVPFSLGAMDCLGRVYATSLIKTLVVRVLRRVELEADGAFEDLELNVAISVKLARGYNLRCRPRDKSKNMVRGCNNVKFLG